jgi:hypothetical protein
MSLAWARSQRRPIAPEAAVHPVVRPRQLLTAAVVGVGAAAVGLCSALPAHAGSPGHWTTLDNSGISNTSQPTTVRIGSTLTVAWTADQGSGEAIRTRTVSAAGAAGAKQTAVSGWSALSPDPKLLPGVSGGRQLLFGGIRTTNVSEPYNGDNVYRATAGTSWSLAPATTFADSYVAYSGYGYGVVRLPSGRTVVAYSLNNTVYLSDDAAHANHLNVPGSATGYNTSLVRDSATGAVWLVVYAGDSSSTSTTRTGVWAHRFDMSTGLVPVGDWTRLPGSVTHNQYGWNAINLLQDQPVASPSGGGAYVAYGMGYPTITKIRVQRLGSSSGFTVAAKGGASKLSLASSGAKLWLSWANPGKVWAARSNAAKTRLGALRHLSTPGTGASVYQLASDGATGRLDLVVTAQAYPKPLAVSHTQVLAGLSVKLSKKKIKSAKGGTEKITVTDAGVAVAGAKVKVGSTAKKTNAKGKVKFTVPKGSATGTYKVVVKSGGYAKAKAKFRVR